MGSQKGAALFEMGTWILRASGWDWTVRRCRGARGVAQGPPRALSAHPWERLRFGSCVAFKINMLSVTKATLFT